MSRSAAIAVLMNMYSGILFPIIILEKSLTTTDIDSRHCRVDGGLGGTEY